MRPAHEGANRAEPGGLAGSRGGPELDFAVDSAGVMEYAAAPTLRFSLRVTNRAGEPVRNVALATQIRIAAAKRSYDPATQSRLVELFGEPHRWGSTVHSLFWVQVMLLVPAFAGSTIVELPVPCTYDMDVAAARYFHGLIDGEVPLEFFFSGTVFYTSGSGALQTSRIALDREATYRLPVSVWREMMAHYFPNSAWLRVSKELFERLHAYRARNTFATWDDAVAALLSRAEGAAGMPAGQGGEVQRWTR